MDKTFWIQKWEKNEIAFHEPDANPTLVKHFKKLSLKTGSRVFIPLCGKTLDIAWLLSQGYRVAGAELSDLAVEQLFTGLKTKPSITMLGDLKHFSAKNIDIFVGDIFHLTAQKLGKIDAIYDRAALVALPKDMRQRYTAHLIQLTASAPQLLITYVYDQNIMAGPPFSVTNNEVEGHYKKSYAITLLENISIPGGLKGCPAEENVWLMERRS